MNYSKKALLSLVIAVMTVLIFSVGAFAVNEKLYDNKGGIIAISHEGNGLGYPSNSLEAVKSAFKLGADIVSVKIGKTADGILVPVGDGELYSICRTDRKSISELNFDEAKKLKFYNIDKTVSDCNIVSLEKMIKSLGKNNVLVLDNAWKYRDEINALAKKLNTEESLILRTFESAKKITEWKNQSQSKLPVIGIYDGAVVFNAISHLRTLSNSGEIFVQYQSKNYFNVMYGHFTAKRYSAGENARAIAPMFDKDLCGQRNDNIAGWDEMVERGFSAIETNCIEDLLDYCRQNNSDSLSELVEKSENINPLFYSMVSVKKLEKAKSNAKAICENGNSSLGQKQEAYSALIKAMNDLVPDDGSDIQKDSLNITTGKIAAVIIFGSLILAAQIYVFKMKKKK